MIVKRLIYLDFGLPRFACFIFLRLAL